MKIKRKYIPTIVFTFLAGGSSAAMLAVALASPLMDSNLVQELIPNLAGAAVLFSLCGAGSLLCPLLVNYINGNVSNTSQYYADSPRPRTFTPSNRTRPLTQTQATAIPTALPPEPTATNTPVSPSSSSIPPLPLLNPCRASSAPLPKTTKPRN